jgi:3D (Asp-Asp-Asp) domain-containing protein
MFLLLVLLFTCIPLVVQKRMKAWCLGLCRWLLIALLPVPLALEGCYSLKTMGMRKEVVVMETTAYCACKACCGWKRKYGCCLGPAVYASGPHKGQRKQVGITADGSKAKKGTIAADTSLYPFGTIMHVPGYGWGEVHDKGSAIKGNRLDLFFSSHKKALEWGRRRVNAKVYRNR